MTENGARETLEGGATALAILLRHRVRLVLVPAIAAFLLTFVLYLMPREYSSGAVFVPRAEGAMSAVAGLAAQFGLALPAAGGASPRVLLAIVTSREVLRSLVTRRYRILTPRLFRQPELMEVNLVEFFEIEEDNPELGIQKAMEALDDAMSANEDDLGGTVSVQIHLTNADLSLAVCEALLDEVQQANVRLRQSQAHAELEFTQGRLADASESLRVAEDSVQRFLQGNRDFRNSPVLQANYDRLQRALALRQQVAVSLAQAYEQAQIAAVRNTPVIAVVDPPILAVKPDRRHMLLKGIFLYIFFAAVAVVFAFVAEIIRVAGGGEPAERQLQQLITEAKMDIRRILARIPGLRPTAGQ